MHAENSASLKVVGQVDVAAWIHAGYRPVDHQVSPQPRELLAADHHVFLACRNESRATAAIAELTAATGKETVEFLPLDLSSFASTRAAAEAFLARDLPKSILK